MALSRVPRALFRAVAIHASAGPFRDRPIVPLTCGALGGTRTPNLLIRSQMLYPLSYERS
jgi:hypothetical protein